MLYYWYLIRYDFLPVCYGVAFLTMAAMSFWLGKSKQFEELIDNAVGFVPNENYRRFSNKCIPWGLFCITTLFYAFAAWASVFSIHEQLELTFTVLYYLLMGASAISFYLFCKYTSENLKIGFVFGFPVFFTLVFVSAITNFYSQELSWSFLYLAIYLPLIAQIVVLLKALGKALPKFEYNTSILRICVVAFYIIVFTFRVLSGNIFSTLDSFAPDYELVQMSCQILLVFITFLCSYFLWSWGKSSSEVKGLIFKYNYLPYLLFFSLIICFFFVTLRCSNSVNLSKNNIQRVALDFALRLNPTENLSWNDVRIEGPTDYSKLVVENIINLSSYYKMFHALEFFIPIEDGFRSLARVHICPKAENEISYNNDISDIDEESNDELSQVLESKKPLVADYYKRDSEISLVIYVPIRNETKNETIGILACYVNNRTWIGNFLDKRIFGIIALLFILVFPIISLFLLDYSDNKKKLDFFGYQKLSASLLLWFYLLGLTVIAVNFIERISHERTETGLYLAAEAKAQYLKEVETRISDEIDILCSLVHSKKDVLDSYEEFSGFLTKFSNYTNEYNYKLITAVNGRDIESFENKIRQEKGFEYFEIYDYAFGHKKSTQKQNINRIYWPIVYSYPRFQHNALVGADYSVNRKQTYAIDKIQKSREHFTYCDFDVLNETEFLWIKHLEPIDFDQAGNVTQILEISLPLQHLLNKRLPSEYFLKNNVKFVIEVADVAQSRPLVVFPENEKIDILESINNNANVYLFPLLFKDITFILKIIAEPEHQRMVVYDPSSQVILYCGFVVATILALFVKFMLTRRKELEMIVEEHAEKLEKASSITKSVNNDLPMVSFRLRLAEGFPIIFINNEIKNFTGFSSKICMKNHTPLINFMAHQSRDAFLNFMSDLIERKTKDTADFELINKLEQRNLTPVSLTALPHLDAKGKVDWIDGFMLNNSEEKAAEKELNDSLDELIAANKKLRLLTQESDYLSEKTAKAKNIKNLFISNMTMQSKVPMHIILETSKKFLDSELDPNQKEIAKSLNQNTNLFYKLVDDIFTYAEIMNGKVSLNQKKMNVSEITGQVIQNHIAAAEEKGIEIKNNIGGNIPNTVIGDGQKLLSILNCFVDNAIKFTQQGSVSIFVEKIEETSRKIKIGFSIQDTGIGIAHSDLKNIFKPFTQVDASNTRKFGGTGLGLAISKGFIELMQGEVGVRSEQWKGSVFWFNINFNKV